MLITWQRQESETKGHDHWRSRSGHESDEIENHHQKVKNEPDDDITTSKRLGSLQR